MMLPTIKSVDGHPKGNGGLNRNSPGLDALAKAGLLSAQNGGDLNPRWCDGFMGFPPGWSELDEESASSALGIPSAQSTRRHSAE
jgi:hypothetical protein